jgi:hypothetical protein
MIKGEIYKKERERERERKRKRKEFLDISN